MLNRKKTYYRTLGGNVSTLYKGLSENGHILIAGATGSGKSVVLNGIIYTLLLTKTPVQCGFILIDPKRVELTQYRKLPHVVSYASEPKDIINALRFALNETEKRFTCMQKEGKKEYTGPDLYIIIDELADLMLTDKKEAEPLLQRLSQIGRSARIHIIACTQNVLAVTIPTTIKCNFPVVLGLRTATKQQSRFLIAESGCELLPDPKRTGTGFGFLRDGANLTKWQLHMHTDEEINSVIRYWQSNACIVRQ